MGIELRLPYDYALWYSVIVCDCYKGGRSSIPTYGDSLGKWMNLCPGQPISCEGNCVVSSRCWRDTNIVSNCENGLLSLLQFNQIKIEICSSRRRWCPYPLLYHSSAIFYLIGASWWSVLDRGWLILLIKQNLTFRRSLLIVFKKKNWMFVGCLATSLARLYGSYLLLKKKNCEYSIGFNTFDWHPTGPALLFIPTLQKFNTE